MSEVKIRAALKDGKCEVKALLTHPMETGRRKDPAGNLIPAHHIQTVELLHNGNLMVEADWGGAISTNPFFSVSLNNVTSGDTIEATFLLIEEDPETGARRVVGVPPELAGVVPLG
jgi:sulfur-oxidizing protein SoxZ